MWVSRLLKHTVDPHPSIRFPALKTCDPDYGFPGRNGPPVPLVRETVFLMRGENVGTER